MKRVTILRVFFATLLLTFAAAAYSADYDAVAEKLKAAMAAPGRPQADVIRDANRKPIKTLKFFGLRDNMRVVELFPGRGWYTRLLAPVLRDKGDLYIAYGTRWDESHLLGKAPFDKVKVAARGAKLIRVPGAGHTHGGRGMNMENADLGVSDVDMVLTFRNYHDLTPAGRLAMNKAIFKALKPGGIYGVVDHTRRHMEPDNPENGRRVDPVEAIKSVQAAGFVLVDYSTLHYRPDDELRYEVGRKTVTGNTDRFTLKFMKPLK